MFLWSETHTFKTLKPTYSHGFGRSFIRSPDCLEHPVLTADLSIISPLPVVMLCAKNFPSLKYIYMRFFQDLTCIKIKRRFRFILIVSSRIYVSAQQGFIEIRTVSVEIINNSVMWFFLKCFIFKLSIFYCFCWDKFSFKCIQSMSIILFCIFNPFFKYIYIFMKIGSHNSVCLQDLCLTLTLFFFLQ